MFAAKGIYSNWDRLGNIATGIEYLQNVKKQVSKSVKSGYQGKTHTAVDTSVLVWRIANKARELQLQVKKGGREGNKDAKPVKDLQQTGYEMFARASLATFNKKIAAMKEGLEAPDETDDIAPMNMDISIDTDENGIEEVSVFHDDTETD